MNYWKLILFGIIVLLVCAGIVWLYISVATELDQEPDSLNRGSFIPGNGGLGQVFGQSISK